jgi:signal transduction histidine kinase
MFDRLWLRLLVGMGLALALAVGTIAALSNRATSESFAEYVEDVSAARAARAESVLSRHYQRQQGWAGVEPIIQLIADFSGQRVVLADGNGVVVADSQRRLVGQYVQPDWAGDPVIITHQERPVGSVYLDPLRPANRPDTRGLTFLAAANQYLLWAAAVGLLAALIASLLLARWLAAPLEALTRAARRMEHGDLSQAIEVRIGGEVGELARAFNATAASLNRLQQLRKQMVADIAHELRTPLTNIRGYLEAIQDGVAEPDEATLGILEHELTQLTRLVDDLQELALVEAGGLTLDRQEVDPAAVVSRGVLALRPQADALGIDLRARIASDLPRMSADGGRLEQALANVLRNALAHTPRGGAVTVTAGLDGDESVGVWDRGSVGGGRESAHALQIVVRDTGTGIAAEDLPHVFERFYRGDRSRARKGLGGYGLGLTITRELIQAHGGQIGVSSVLGRGTEFTIRLPLAPPEPSSTEEPTVEPVRAAPPRPAGRLLLPLPGPLVGTG